MKVLISLFDHSGVSSLPYKENGWEVVQIDIKHGQDVLQWDYRSWFSSLKNPTSIGIIAMIPCTDYALSGARWFKLKDESGMTRTSDLLVEKTKEIIEYFSGFNLLFWQIENPMSRIHTRHKWMGSPLLKFNPCDYAGYSNHPEKNSYNKKTWLWGKFNIPEKKYIKPLQKEFPGHVNLGGKSERTKELRSITPDGFAKAFYEFNH